MTTPATSFFSNFSATRIDVFLWLLLLIMLAPISRADEGTEKMLENLKRRTAQERWERVKKMYPTPSTTARQTTPAQLPAESQPGAGGFEVPPSPQETALIPRMSPVAEDHSNDWILPAREPVIEDEPVAQNSASYEGQEITTPPAAIKIAAQDTATDQGSDTTGEQVPQRALNERKITDIAPFYDRERDSDIRQFAIEKGRELDIEFKPKPFVPRSFPEIVLAWEATNFTYRPLYFADPALERYGHSYHPVIQPIASIARFGTQFCFWPYQATIEPPCKEESPLGYYRPGDVIPKLHYQIPLNAEAAAVQAGFVTGLYFIIP
jgi:hypothetical protein